MVTRPRTKIDTYFLPESFCLAAQVPGFLNLPNFTATYRTAPEYSLFFCPHR